MKKQKTKIKVKKKDSKVFTKLLKSLRKMHKEHKKLEEANYIDGNYEGQF